MLKRFTALLVSALLIAFSSLSVAQEKIPNAAQRSAAQQIVDNQWINLADNFQEDGNLVIEAIKAKNPDWVITSAKRLAEQFRREPAKAFATYHDKPILILATTTSVIKGNSQKDTFLELKTIPGQPSIKAYPGTEEDRAYILDREPGWFEILLCKQISDKDVLELAECSSTGTTLPDAIDEADSEILEALMGKGKTANAIQAAVVAVEVAKTYPKGPLSFDDGMEYGKAVEKITNALTFEKDPKKFLEIAEELGYRKDFIERLFRSEIDSHRTVP